MSRGIWESSTQRPKGHSNFIFKLLESTRKSFIVQLGDGVIAVLCRGVILDGEKWRRLAVLQVKPFRSSDVSHALLGFSLHAHWVFGTEIWAEPTFTHARRSVSCGFVCI